MPEAEPIDVIVVGGGPAGWSAALVLGRARRRVVLIDAGNPRNRASRGVHAFLTREGTPPLELLRQARAEALTYPSVRTLQATVTAVARDDTGFDVGVDDGKHRPGATLYADLGCDLGGRGSVDAHPVSEQASVPGVYVAGDASRDVLLAIVAAAEGAKAAIGINKALLKEEGRL